MFDPLPLVKGGTQELLERIIARAEALSIQISSIETITNDCFWRKSLNVQEEKRWHVTDFASDAVHAAARRLGVATAVILTVSENAVTAKRVPEGTRQSRFSNAAMLAVESYGVI